MIDALDESCERGEMVNHFKHLTQLADSMNILITSCIEQDIIMELQSNIDVVKCIQRAKIDDDVKLYVSKCLDTDSSLKRCLPVQEYVKKALVNGANGMYIPAIVIANESQVSIGHVSVRRAPKMLYYGTNKENITAATKNIG